MMKRLALPVAVAVAAAATLLVAAGPASAATRTVCAHGCAFTSIQAAIDAASPGDTIVVGPGTYVENLTVTKSLTIRGFGNATVLYPALSGPTCAGGSLCAGGSNMILVRADDVTLQLLRLEGDNPGLTSGVVAGGADIDARNGIITDHTAGTWNDLTVAGVKVSDIYLRGIYASSGGTFSFVGNRVDNVEADPASIAIFNFGGSGIVAANAVTSANDAISANHSRGTQFLLNDVSKSASGIHTDNNGDSGGAGDTIKFNRVHNCTTDGYGIWTFAPYLPATISSNLVQGCAVGLAAFADAVSGQGPAFKDNDVEEAGAQASGPDGTYGAYVTTDFLGFGAGRDVNATFTGNSFEHFDTGMLATETRYFYGDTPGGTATVVAHNNSFLRNGVGFKAETAAQQNAESNWWGCKTGPNSSPSCDTTSGPVDYTPWLTKKPH